ncbi:unnamed protein product [Parajaminaea phylloscopi]
MRPPGSLGPPSSQGRLSTSARRFSVDDGNYHPDARFNESAGGEVADAEYDERTLGEYRRSMAEPYGVDDARSAAEGYSPRPLASHHDGAYDGYPRTLLSEQTPPWPSHVADPHIAAAASANSYYDPYEAHHDYFYAPPVLSHKAASSASTLAHSTSFFPVTPLSDRPHTMFGIQADHHLPDDVRGQNDERLPSFPHWSSTWYGGHHSANGHAYTAVRPPSGASGWESETLTHSGRGHVANGVPYLSAAQERQFVKQERMKMLEKKFGKPKVRHRGDALEGHIDDAADCSEGDDEDQYPDDIDAGLPPGSVTSRGTLVLSWRRTTLTLVVATVLFALSALLSAVLALVVIKVPADSAKPGIKSHWTSYLVHAASLLAALSTVWLFVFRPCCCDAGRKAAKGSGPPGASGLPQFGAGMIVPMLGSAQERPTGRGLFGKRRKQMMQGAAPPTVNLIVDPALLVGGNKRSRRRRRHGDDDSDSSSSDSEGEDDWDPLPGEFRRRTKRDGRTHARPRGAGGFLGRIQTERTHNLALRSFLLSILYNSAISVLCLVALCVAIFMSGGKATHCAASQADTGPSISTPGTPWCATWSSELAMLFLYVFAAWAWVVFAVMTYRKGKQAQRHVSRSTLRAA